MVVVYGRNVNEQRFNIDIAYIYNWANWTDIDTFSIDDRQILRKNQVLR